MAVELNDFPLAIKAGDKFMTSSNKIHEAADDAKYNKTMKLTSVRVVGQERPISFGPRARVAINP